MESTSNSTGKHVVVLEDPQEIIRYLKFRNTELKEELAVANSTIQKLNEEATNFQAIIKVLQEDNERFQANLAEVGNAEELQHELVNLTEKLEDDKSVLDNNLGTSLEANEDLEKNLKQEREEIESPNRVGALRSENTPSSSNSDGERPPTLLPVASASETASLNLRTTPGKSGNPRKRLFPDMFSLTGSLGKKQQFELLRLQCGLCYIEPFLMYPDFQQHLRNEHSITDPFQPYYYEFKCNVCGKKTPRDLNALREHQYNRANYNKCAENKSTFVFTELTHLQRMTKWEKDNEERRRLGLKPGPPPPPKNQV